MHKKEYASIVQTAERLSCKKDVESATLSTSSKFKICNVCHINKPYPEFGDRGGERYNKPRSYCKSCQSEISRKNSKKLKIEAFLHYGGCICACCGVDELVFLSLDHANNDGSAERKKRGYPGGTPFYKWLKNNSYPQNLNLQVLCFNCNHGRYINGGTCPHKISSDSSLVERRVEATGVCGPIPHQTAMVDIV